MGAVIRHRVGRTVLAGYLVIRPEDEGFFQPLPERDGRRILLVYGDDQHVEARLVRARSKRAELKLAYTGRAGVGFRAWLKRRFPALKSSKVRGILELQRIDPDRFLVRAESLSQAEIELLTPGPRRYLAGARPVCVLHPAMLERILKEVQLPSVLTPGRLWDGIQRRLGPLGWRPVSSIGGGLALAGGLGLAGAQLHLVAAAADLYLGLVAVAAGFALGDTDLGILLVADGRLAEGLRADGEAPAASLGRAEREAAQLEFLLRGPTVLIGLGTRREIR